MNTKHILGIILFSFLHIVSSHASAFPDSRWGVIAYKSSKVENVLNLNVEGIDLVGYGYVEVYQYVIVNDDTLFVLGAAKPEERSIPLLSLISLDNHETTIIKQYSRRLSWSLPKATFTVFFLQSLQPSLPFVMIEYTDGNINRYSEETVIYWELFRADEKDKYTLLRKEQIGKTDIVYAGTTSESDIPYQYVHVASLESENISEEAEPARAVRPTILLSDVNNDGYADILVWRNFYVSQMKEDIRKEGSFILDKEELHVMYFMPESRTFSSLTPLNSKQWKALGELLFSFQ